MPMDHPSTSYYIEKVIFGVLYCSIAVIAFSCNCVLFYTFTKITDYRHLSFYTIARQVIAADAVACLIHLYVGAPSTIFERSVYSEIPPLQWLFEAMLFLEFAPHSASVLFVLLMAIHRLFIFTMPRLEEAIFQGASLIVCIIVVWTMILTETLALELFGCQKLFSFTQYFFFWDCTENTFSNSFFEVDVVVSFALPVVIFALNTLVIVIVYFKVKYSTAGRHHHVKQEISMLFQNCFLCGCIMLHAASFNILGRLTVAQQEMSVYITLCQNLISVLTCMLQPMTYLLFNRKVRHDVKVIIFRARRNGTTPNKGVSNSVTVVAAAQIA